MAPRTAAHQLAGDLLSDEVPSAAVVTAGRERRVAVAEGHKFTAEGCPACYGCRIYRCVHVFLLTLPLQIVDRKKNV